MPFSDDLDLSHWLRHGEDVRWTGRPAHARVPWLPVIGMGVGSVIAAGVFVWAQHGEAPAFFYGFVVLIVAINVANAIGILRRAYRAEERNRYILTNQRAAIFESPGQLVAETRADTTEFQAKRSPLTRAGDIDWGESGYEGPAAGRLSTLLRMNSLRYEPGVGRVVFADLANFDAAYHAAMAVRADLGRRRHNLWTPRCEVSRRLPWERSIARLQGSSTPRRSASGASLSPVS